MRALRKKSYLSEEAYLEFEEQSDIKHEYVDGDVYQNERKTPPFRAGIAACFKDNQRGGLLLLNIFTNNLNRRTNTTPRKITW